MLESASINQIEGGTHTVTHNECRLLRHGVVTRNVVVKCYSLLDRGTVQPRQEICNVHGKRVIVRENLCRIREDVAFARIRHYECNGLLKMAIAIFPLVKYNNQRNKGRTALSFFLESVTVGRSIMKVPSTTGTNVKMPSKFEPVMISPASLSVAASVLRKHARVPSVQLYI
jgi:hypothetical protein